MTPRARFLRLAACAAVLAVLVPAARASITWRCPYCKETYSFDSRDGAYAAAMRAEHLASCPARPGPADPLPEPPATAAPSALPGLVRGWRDLRGRIEEAYRPFLAHGLPAGESPRSLEDMARMLSALRDYGEDRIGRLESADASLRADIAGLEALARRDERRGDALREELDRLRKEVMNLEAECGGDSAILVGARAEIARLETLARRIGEDAAPAREAIFARLAALMDKGAIGPPGAFLPPPSPREPGYRREEWSVSAEAAPAVRPASDLLVVAEPVAVLANPIPVAPPRKPFPAAEEDLRRGLESLENLPPRLRKAVDGYRASEERKRRAGEAAGVAAARAEGALRATEALEEAREDARKRLAVLRHELREAKSRISKERTAVLLEVAAWALWKRYDRETKEMAELHLGPGVNMEILIRFRKVMQDVALLAQDVLAVLPKAASELGSPAATDGETEALLKDCVDRFQVRFALDASGLPSPLARFLQPVLAKVRGEEGR